MKLQQCTRSGTFSNIRLLGSPQWMPSSVPLAAAAAAALALLARAQGAGEGAPPSEAMPAVKDDSERYRSDYSYYPAVGGWLRFSRLPADWHEARLRCHLEGGVLASPLNATLSWALRSAAQADGLARSIFTGIHATFSRGDFASVEGVPLSHIPARWAAGEPNNLLDEEQCLLLLPDGSLADAPCASTHPYVCYRQKTPDLVLNACGTFDNGYTLDSTTGSCYKFHVVPRTWSRAYMACAAEGGHLAVLNSEAEAKVIKALFANYPPAQLQTKSPFGKDIVYLGFQSRDEPGEWMTIHGQTLQQAGYSYFEPGQPDNNTGGPELCGGVFRSGNLDDLWCEYVYSFICEKKPDSLFWDGSSQ